MRKNLPFRVKHVIQMKLADLSAATNPLKRKERKRWLTQDGVTFLRGVGVTPGTTIVDFGCGTGGYSIPAAHIVGPGGRVLSVDMESQPALYFSNLSIDDIVKEIEMAGFHLHKRNNTTLWHSHGCTSGTVLIFRKTTGVAS